MMRFQEHKNFISAFFILALGGLLFYVTKPYLPQQLFSETASNNDIVVDSLMLDAIENMPSDSPTDDQLSRASKKDSLSPSPSATPTRPKPVIDEDTPFIQLVNFDFYKTHAVDATGLTPIPPSLPLKSYKGMEHLEAFFEKLYALEQQKSGQVRIAYYGDSMIDGDLIVQDFRSAMQNRFGGRGVGFVPMVSESARSRYSVKHYAKGNWQEKNYMKGRADSIPYGVNGAVYFPADSTARVTYVASGIKNAYRLNQPKLFYGPGQPDASLAVTLNKDTLSQTLELGKTKSLNSVTLAQQNLKKLQLDFENAVDVPIYGVDFSSSTGVAVDGFSNRGNSGMPLSLLDKQQMSAFDDELGYDLIILQFGANVLSTNTQQFNWYARRMQKVVQHLKQLFPEADILVLGTADKGTKIDQVVKTDSTVVRLLSAQQQYAARTESGFMSLFHLMGGVHSMPVWNQHKWANNDYTHFSSQGSRKIGRMIFREMMLEYSAFAKAKKAKELEQQKIDSLAQIPVPTLTDSLNKELDE